MTEIEHSHSDILRELLIVSGHLVDVEKELSDIRNKMLDKEVADHSLTEELEQIQATANRVKRELIEAL